jgi:PAS domain S-box-containing protein
MTTLASKSVVRRYLARLAYAKEFLLLVALLALLLGILVVLTYTGVSMVSAMRAYVNGEALYSKAQKDAVYYLSQYAATQREEFYVKYEEAIAVPKRISRARVLLDGPDPSLEAIREQLRGARIPPGDLPERLWTVQLIRHLPPMTTAFSLWAEADQLLHELDRLAIELHDEITTGRPSSRHIAEVLQEIDRLNVNLTNLEAAFSSTLGETARWMQRVVVLGVSGGAILLLLFALIPMRGVLLRLKKSQEKFRRLFEQSRDAIILLMPDGSISYANPAACELFGYPREASQQEGFNAFRAENIFTSASERWRFIETVQQDGYAHDFEAEMSRQDGTPIDCLINSTLITDHRGEVVGFETIIRDITERKRTEARMRVLERAVEASGTGIFLSDARHSDHPLIYVNPAFERMTGYTASEAIGHSIASLVEADPEVMQELHRSLHQGVPARVVLQSARKDGLPFWSEISLAPVHDDDGTLIHYVGVQTDITESKQAEQALVQALDKEIELGELRSRFVTMVSHEFRTPLATILSSSELVERFRHRWPDDRILKHLHRIQTSVETMTHLLENVLVVGKVEAGQMRFNPSEMDLASFCREVAEDVWLGQGQEHHLDLALPERPVLIHGDAELLRYALNNLLGNAIKYAQAGSTVQFGLTTEANQAVLQVTDEGIGIPEDDLDAVFEPFHRAANAENMLGTGLGLSIARRAVEMHQGTIRVESEEGAGTRFTVTLPLASDETDDRAPAEADRTRQRDGRPTPVQ